MRFTAVPQFSGPAEVVMGKMIDPHLYLNLSLPAVGQPDVLDRDDDGTRASLRLRYTYSGQLNPLARRILGNEPLSWTQITEIDITAKRARLVYASEDPAHRLRGEANIEFATLDGASTRRIEGELVLAIRIARAAAERSVVAGLLGRLDLEAAAIEASIVAG
jgi:hypothetical protein